MDKRAVAVLGFGKTGQAVLDYLLAHEPHTPLWLFNDDAIAEGEPRRSFERRGVRFLTGADRFAELAGCGRVVMSPGFDGQHPRFAALRRGGAEVISEIEFAFRRLQARVIAVSGSNGKSTTVSLVQHLLTSAGVRSRLAGNIGTPLIAEIDAIPAGSLAVLELSSFQLEEIDRFRPEVAVLLNVTPDHLDRYPSMAEYSAAKFNLFRNQEPDDVMVLNADDPLLRDAGKLGRGRPFWFSISRPQARGAHLEGQDLVLDMGAGRETVSLRRNPLRGIHNLENIMAAALACRAVGLDAAAIEAGLAGFRGLAASHGSGGSRRPRRVHQRLQGHQRRRGAEIHRQHRRRPGRHPGRQGQGRRFPRPAGAAAAAGAPGPAAGQGRPAAGRAAGGPGRPAGFRPRPR